MEISRRDHHGGRWNPGNNRNPRFSNGVSPPINYNPWNKRFSPVDPDYQPEQPHGPPPHHRGPHPYRRPNSRPPPRPTNVDPRNIPSLLAIELPPMPLMATNNGGPSSSYDQYEEEPYEQYEEEQYDEDESLEDRVPLTDEEYLREEQKTKQQIEEIIAVAQALREKLDREEELRRQAESIPKLMDLKPRIPSLLEIYVPPPPQPLIPEETCWNCNRPGHRFIHCKERKQNRFCYKCGTHGFDIVSCPSCRTKYRPIEP